jgi:hypothetical protein
VSTDANSGRLAVITRRLIRHRRADRPRAGRRRPPVSGVGHRAPRLTAARPRMPFPGHAPHREPASVRKSVPHTGADPRGVFRAVSENERRARPVRRVRAGDGLRRGQRRRDAVCIRQATPPLAEERATRPALSPRSRRTTSGSAGRDCCFDDGSDRRRHARGLARSPVGRSANARFGAGDRRGRQDRQARASPRAAGRPRDRAPRGVCDHAPGSDASSTRNDTPSAAAVERALWARSRGEAQPPSAPVVVSNVTSATQCLAMSWWSWPLGHSLGQTLPYWAVPGPAPGVKRRHCLARFAGVSAPWSPTSAMLHTREDAGSKPAAPIIETGD